MRKCKCCKNPFTQTRPLQYLCGVSCAIAYSRIKRNEKQQKEWRVQRRELKEKLKTLSDYKKDARRVFQKWIRQRDKDLPCISCGCKTAVQWDGGHLFKAELYSGLVFDECNVHKQCSRCNDLYSGNELAYREGLISRYGEQYVKDLEIKKDAAREFKYTKQQLIDIKNKYQKLINKNG